MRPRHIAKQDMGEAISIEDAISMMTIIFVLFVVFLVPLISIDKAHLEQRVKDDLWTTAVQTISQVSTPHTLKACKAYSSAFELGDMLAAWTTHKGDAIWVEVLTSDSILVVIQHHQESNSFQSFRMGKDGETVVYRHGELGWSRSGHEWFVLDDGIDYGESKESQDVMNTYRQWRGSKK